jgi:hypothetical protein
MDFDGRPDLLRKKVMNRDAKNHPSENKLDLRRKRIDMFFVGAAITLVVGYAGWRAAKFVCLPSPTAQRWSSARLSKVTESDQKGQHFLRIEGKAGVLCGNFSVLAPVRKSVEDRSLEPNPEGAIAFECMSQEMEYRGKPPEWLSRMIQSAAASINAKKKHGLQ